MTNAERLHGFQSKISAFNRHERMKCQWLIGTSPESLIVQAIERMKQEERSAWKIMRMMLKEMVGDA